MIEPPQAKTYLPSEKRCFLNDGGLNDLLSRKHTPCYGVSGLFESICLEIALRPMS